MACGAQGVAGDSLVRPSEQAQLACAGIAALLADAVTVAIDIDFVTEAWRKVLVVKDRPGKVRRHLEVCVFSYLASELRSGDIAVVGADSYANLHAQLMSSDECVPLAEKFCGQAGIPSDPKQLTAHYRAALTDVAAVVDAGFPHNTDLSLRGRPPDPAPPQRRRRAPIRARPGRRDPSAPPGTRPAGHPGPHRAPAPGGLWG
ncbi:hypothetical protein AB0383_22875 [Amycolatopsis sp. NPDC051373]|uniref:hypothetical protein n=1 Tax=Amycolatopsis sp. NPDC051373 TaxID=3155801 RepID=UPI00344DCA8E